MNLSDARNHGMTAEYRTEIPTAVSNKLGPIPSPLGTGPCLLHVKGSHTQSSWEHKGLKWSSKTAWFNCCR